MYCSLYRFWATVCKTVRPMLSDRCPVLSVLSCLVSNDGVGLLWSNGWTDQDETWRAGRLTWGNGNGCPPVVHYWADLQSVHVLRCYDNIAPSAKCQRMFVLALCLVIMAAQRSRCGHYIFALWFLSSIFFFISRLISAFADWMSTILLHIVWPKCEFRMQV